VGQPRPGILAKTITALDDHCRALIATAPFVLVASADAQGRTDVSPKGDGPGFVRVLDDQTLVIPDRPGNRRADTFHNVLQNPHVALLFLVPGMAETLRVMGRAGIVRDASQLEQMAVNGKPPKLALAVDVDEAFIHCPKCIVRSDLWNPRTWSDRADLPAFAEMVRDHRASGETAEQIQREYEDALSESGLY
jgi:hypothetical protein